MIDKNIFRFCHLINYSNWFVIKYDSTWWTSDRSPICSVRCSSDDRLPSMPGVWMYGADRKYKQITFQPVKKGKIYYLGMIDMYIFYVILLFRTQKLKGDELGVVSSGRLRLFKWTDHRLKYWSNFFICNIFLNLKIWSWHFFLISKPNRHANWVCETKAAYHICI